MRKLSYRLPYQGPRPTLLPLIKHQVMHQLLALLRILSPLVPHTQRLLLLSNKQTFLPCLKYRILLWCKNPPLVLLLSSFGFRTLSHHLSFCLEKIRKRRRLVQKHFVLPVLLVVLGVPLLELDYLPSEKYFAMDSYSVVEAESYFAFDCSIVVRVDPRFELRNSNHSY